MKYLMLALAFALMFGAGMLIGSQLHPTAFASEAKLADFTYNNNASGGTIGPANITPTPTNPPVYGYGYQPRWQVMVIPVQNGQNRSLTMLLDTSTGNAYYLDFNARYYWSPITRN